MLSEHLSCDLGVAIIAWTLSYGPDLQYRFRWAAVNADHQPVDVLALNHMQCSKSTRLQPAVRYQLLDASF